MDNSSKEAYKELLKKSKEIQSQINDIENKYGNDNKMILEGINAQRFYFIKNKPKVIFDSTTGLLWANLNEFPYKGDGNGHVWDCWNCNFESYITSMKKIMNNWANFSGWRFPRSNEIYEFSLAKDNPFYMKKGIYGLDRYLCVNNGKNQQIELDAGGYCDGVYNGDGCGLFPCNDSLIKGTDYVSLVSSGPEILSKEERGEVILKFFLQHDMIPAFKKQGLTVAFEKICLEKPTLIRNLHEVEEQICKLQNKVELTLDFDYLPLMEKYDLPAIEKSVIKYYEAVQSWCDEMLDKLNDYEKSHADLIADFNKISVQLATKYIANDKLTEAENGLLAARQAFFRKKLALSMGGVKRKIVSFKQQANALEDRIDDINEGDDALHELAAIEKEALVSFPFLAENTGKIIRNALNTTEYFRTHREFIKFAIAAWDSWSKDYLHFKTAGFAQIQSSCQEDGIEDEVWQVWCQDWSDLRYKVEQKLQPLIERGLKGDIPTIQGDKNVIEELVKVLAAYKAAIDNFFLEERKAVYQNFFFQAGGELQEKFESELKLYRCTVKLQSDLQKLIFNCSEVEDRMFILTWASDLLNIQIDELLTYVADQRFTKISEKVLNDFAQLRLQNLDVYLNDAKAYGQEKERREKEFNSLMFKMRKEAMK